MTGFVQRHLDPAARLGEVLFGLIMALGFTAAVSVSDATPNSRELSVAIFGCNLAWGIVDGVMYLLEQLFERGRRARIVRDVLAAPDEASALAAIAREIDRPLEHLTSEAERHALHRSVLAVARRTELAPVRVHADDLLGALAVALAIVLATLPVVAPFVLIDDPALAVRVSNGVAVAGLGLVGARWGQLVGASPLRIALGLTAIGLALVAIMIALGG